MMVLAQKRKKKIEKRVEKVGGYKKYRASKKRV